MVIMETYIGQIIDAEFEEVGEYDNVQPLHSLHEYFVAKKICEQISSTISVRSEHDIKEGSELTLRVWKFERENSIRNEYANMTIDKTISLKL